VITTTKGYPFTENNYQMNSPAYDEIVIGQEGQVLPLFLLEIDHSNLSVLIQIFQKHNKTIQLDDLTIPGSEDRKNSRELPLLTEPDDAN